MEKGQEEFALPKAKVCPKPAEWPICPKVLQ